MVVQIKRLEKRINKKGFVKRGNILVGMNGDVCCSKTNCPHRSIVGRCKDINAECECEEERDEAILQCMFDNDEIAIGIRYESNM